VSTLNTYTVVTSWIRLLLVQPERWLIRPDMLEVSRESHVDARCGISQLRCSHEENP
jgi:hypothetical protein